MIHQSSWQTWFRMSPHLLCKMTHHEFLTTTHLQGERHGRAGVGPLQPQPVRQGEAGLGVLEREEGGVSIKICPMCPKSSRGK